MRFPSLLRLTAGASQQAGAMTFAHDIYTTQQIANAAERFVDALGDLFPGESFNELFHGGTLRRAYWSALQAALDRFAAPEKSELVKALMDDRMIADDTIIAEFLKLFDLSQQPNYVLIAGRWASVISVLPDDEISLVAEAEAFFTLLAEELRRLPDLRLVLHQIGRAPMEDDDAFDPVMSTAEQDLGRLIDTAVMAGPGTIALQVRHLMALAGHREPFADGDVNLALEALTYLAGQLDADKLRKLWHAVERMDDPARRARGLARLAPHLSRRGLITNALTLVDKTLATTSLDSGQTAARVALLLELAPHLKAAGDDSSPPTFQQRALDAALSIGDPASRVRALGALIENLSPDLQPEAVSQAFEATRAIPSDMARATALSTLPPHLPAEFHVPLLSIAYELQKPEARALLMVRMVPHMPAPQQSQVLIDALNAIAQINGDDARAAALIALTPYIDAVGPLKYMPEGLQQAIEVVFTITRSDDRARAFAALAPYLSPELLQEALQATKTIADPGDRALALTKLAPHLPSELLVAAFGVARELATPESRALALVALAPYLTATARTQALSDALAASLAIESKYERVVSLVDLAPHLSDPLQGRALDEALTATRSIPGEDERGRALVFLAPHLRADQLANALADAYTILDPLERVPALSALMPHLPPEPRRRVGYDVIETARSLKPSHQKASLLAAVAPVLPDGLLHAAIDVALSVEPPYDRVHVLTALLPRRPEALRDVALAAAHAVPNRYPRVNALLELVPHVSSAQRETILEEVLETALGIDDDYDRASALAHLAPFIDSQSEARNRQEDALSMALEACLALPEMPERVQWLARWAGQVVELLPPAQVYTLWKQIVPVLRTQSEAEVLASLAALAPLTGYLGAHSAGEDVAKALWSAVFEAPAGQG